MLDVSTKIDLTGLQRGLAESTKWSRKAPAQVVNDAAFSVAVQARNNMPFVTPETVDSELSVIEHPIIGKRGKPLKGKRRFQSTASAGSDVALAVLIIQASANPGSNYNRLTNSRYALPNSPFKGVSRAAGAALMVAAEDRLIKFRHSSGSFLKAGWANTVRVLRPYVKWARMPAGFISNANEKLGGATPALAGQTMATCTIENDIGMEGVNRASFDRALQEYGAPGLQDAVDTVGRREMDYSLMKANQELERDVNKHWA